MLIFPPGSVGGIHLFILLASCLFFTLLCPILFSAVDILRESSSTTDITWLAGSTHTIAGQFDGASLL